MRELHISIHLKTFHFPFPPTKRLIVLTFCVRLTALPTAAAAAAALQKVHITNFNWTCVSWKFNFRFRCRCHCHFRLAYCICYACGWLMLTFGLLAYLLHVWLILCCRLVNVQISCGSNLSNFFSNLFECVHYVAAARCSL